MRNILITRKMAYVSEQTNQKQGKEMSVGREAQENPHEEVEGSAEYIRSKKQTERRILYQCEQGAPKLLRVYEY